MEAVLGGVRWKRAHETVRRELAAHVEDQVEAYLQDGMPKEQAEEKAILDMGDAAQVAKGYDRVLRPRTDRRMLIVLAALYLFAALFGLLRHAVNPDKGGLWADAAGMLLGAGAFAAGYFLDVRPFVRRGAAVYLLYALGLIFCYAAAFTWALPFNLDWAVGGYWLLLAPLAQAFLIGSMRGRGLCAGAACLAAPWLVHALTEGTFSMLGRELLLGIGLMLPFYAFAAGFFPRVRFLPRLYALALLLLAAGPIWTGTFGEYFDLNPFGGRLREMPLFRFDAAAGAGSGGWFLTRAFGWGAFLTVSVPYLFLTFLCLQTGARKKGTGAQMICSAVALSMLMQYACGLANATGTYDNPAWPMPFFDTEAASTVLNLFQIGLVMGIGRMGTLRMD